MALEVSDSMVAKWGSKHKVFPWVSYLTEEEKFHKGFKG